jgi:hypothetical protein
VVEQEVDPRPRHQYRQPSQELKRVEDQIGRTVRPRLPELQPHLPRVTLRRSRATGGRSAYRHTRSSRSRCPAGTTRPACRSQPFDRA